MRTLIIIAVGLILSFAFVFGANAINKGRGESLVNGAYWFIGLWLIFCVYDFYVGVFKAGYSVRDELAIHSIIFAAPAAAAWFLSRQSH